MLGCQPFGTDVESLLPMLSPFLGHNTTPETVPIFVVHTRAAGPGSDGSNAVPGGVHCDGTRTYLASGLHPEACPNVAPAPPTVVVCRDCRRLVLTNPYEATGGLSPSRHDFEDLDATRIAALLERLERDRRVPTRACTRPRQVSPLPPKPA